MTPPRHLSPNIRGRRVWLPVDPQSGAVDWYAIEVNVEDLAPRPWPWQWREFQLAEVPLSDLAERMLRGTDAARIRLAPRRSDALPSLCCVCNREHSPGLNCDPFKP